MPNALLLDLDDTLLHNSMGDFLPRYFGALSQAVSTVMEREPFLKALQFATQKVIRDTTVAETNETVFWEHFNPLLPIPRDEMMPLLNRFYDEVFPTLDADTAPMAGATELVAVAKTAGWKVVVATNPIFPEVANRHRMIWAGLNPADFDLITSYENMHSTKPHASYYAEIAERLGVEARDCVMAGNHLSNDIVGAQAVGMRTFWITEYAIADAEVTPDGEGTLAQLQAWLFAV
jgi:HAD superfamily hydrolase (TIGR01549 family)